MEPNTILTIKNIIIGIILIIWLHYIIYHKNDGVIQKTKTYGGHYFLTTLVYINGCLKYDWVDVIVEEEYPKTKVMRKRLGMIKYDELKNVNS